MGAALETFKRDNPETVSHCIYNPQHLETVEGVGFSHWASYLINGDASGLSEADKQEADSFAEYMGGPIVSCGDDSFFGRPSYPPDALRGDCLDYVALVSPRLPPAY
jgi:hypothetical protein